ncbi:unnamed protein product, partial [Brassica rapa subsp. narinosa]
MDQVFCAERASKWELETGWVFLFYSTSSVSICFLFGVKGVLFLVVSSIIWSSEKLVVWFMIWIINGLLVYWP